MLSATVSAGHLRSDERTSSLRTQLIEAQILDLILEKLLTRRRHLLAHNQLLSIVIAQCGFTLLFVRFNLIIRCLQVI